MKPMLRQYHHRYSISFTKEGRMSAAFLTGLLAGTFFFNMWGKDYIEELLLYKGLLTGRYEAGALAGTALCFYIARKRLPRFLALLFMELTEFCTMGRMLFSAYYGFCTGACLSAFVFQYSLPGIAYFILSLFPHYGAYVIMWQVLNYDTGLKSSKKRLPAAILLFITGIILEGYLHAGLMQKILQNI